MPECEVCGRTCGNQGALQQHMKTHEAEVAEKVQMLENKVREVADSHEVSGQEINEIQNLIGEILSVEDMAYVHGRQTGANLGALKEAAKHLHDLDKSELMNLATNVGGIVLGIRESSKQFSNVREMLNKAKKYDELVKKQEADGNTESSNLVLSETREQQE